MASSCFYQEVSRPDQQRTRPRSMPSRLGSNLDGVTCVDGKQKLRTTTSTPPLLNALTSVRKFYSIRGLSECKDGAGPRPVEFGSHGRAQQARRGGGKVCFFPKKDASE